MKSPTQVFDKLSEIVSKPFDAAEFPYALAAAFLSSKAAVTNLRGGGSNSSDLKEEGGVLCNKQFHYCPAIKGDMAGTIKVLENSKGTKKKKPAMLITTDGKDITAKDYLTEETLHIPFQDLAKNFGFFLPCAGIRRFSLAHNNPADIQATSLLAKLYDDLLKNNPTWKDGTHHHVMNRFMMRLIFCMFSEDVGIFPDKQFQRIIETYSGNKGEEAHLVIKQAFEAMDLKENSPQRKQLPAWTHELKYVNGGLFAGDIEVPHFSPISYRYLRDACALDWKDINPDIFGSMIQSVANSNMRSELGLHYTSVENILKCLKSLFLDEIDADIEKHKDNPKQLHKILYRLSTIRVFDPACGSGNFLVVAYRQLREREMILLKRLVELGDLRGNGRFWSEISVSQFYGIELTDFGAETSKLSLFIAEYQANKHFSNEFQISFEPLPLRDGANVIHGNALRLDWKQVCPPSEKVEVYIVGNPPFVGKKGQDKDQKEDKDFVFKGKIKSYKSLDYVASWYFLASEYIRGEKAKSVLVATNSICQGTLVASLWPTILSGSLEIGFAYHSFKWENNASGNAGVVCVIVGLRNKSSQPKYIFESDQKILAKNINAYLLDAPDITVKDERKRSLFDLPKIISGNNTVNGNNLILSPHDKEELLRAYPQARKFVKRFMGGQELVNDEYIYCLWIYEDELKEALTFPPIKKRVDITRQIRLRSSDLGSNKLAKTPYRFREQNIAKNSAIFIPQTITESRYYLTPRLVDNTVVAGYSNYVIYDPPEWVFSILVSRLHILWIGTVCGRLGTGYRYSNTMGYNTFPVPYLSKPKKQALYRSAWKIQKIRANYFPATLADLYDPKKMPLDLKQAHVENDALLERYYRRTPFEDDTERLFFLFKMYTKRKEEEAKGSSKK